MNRGESTYFTYDVQYTEDRRAHAYFTPNLLGGSVQFEFDTKQMGCGCIGQVSLVAMPAVKEDGTIDESDGYFGCDARGLTGSGAKCPEFTLFEGNRYGFKTTPHTCDDPTETGFFEKCDAEGDLSVDSYDFPKGSKYGPHGAYAYYQNDPKEDFNSWKTMTLKIDFNAESDKLVSYDVTLT